MTPALLDSLVRTEVWMKAQQQRGSKASRRAGHRPAPSTNPVADLAALQAIPVRPT